MVAQVLPFFRRSTPQARDWSQQELAEFYRVESALVQAGALLESDRGLTDEGDPWFIFCRVDTGDVFIHFARIDGVYVVDGAAFEQPARGPDFGALVRQLIERYPLAKIRERSAPNVFVHPAALLIALVGAAFFHSNEAKAAEPGDAKAEAPRRTSLVAATSSLPPGAVGTGAAAPDHGAQAAVILSAVLSLNDDLFSVVASGASTHTAAGPVASPSLDAVSAPLVLRPAETPAISQAALEAAAVHAAVLPVEAAHEAGPAIRTPISIIAGADGAAPPPVQAPLEESTIGRPPEEAPAPLGAPGGAAIFLPKTFAPPPDLDALDALADAGVVTAGVGELLARGLPQVDRLPQNLLELIRRGEHVQWLDDRPVTPVGEAPPVVIPPAPTGETPVEAPSLPTPPTEAPASPALHDAVIDALIAAFIAQVQDLEIIMEGNKLVLYDETIFSPFGGAVNLSSITFTFADGSTVSLVGHAQDLQHLPWPA